MAPKRVSNNTNNGILKITLIFVFASTFFVYFLLMRHAELGTNQNEELDDAMHELALKNFAGNGTEIVVGGGQHNDVAVADSSTPTSSKSQLRPCLIAIQNNADYHYEVIESAIMQYPIPWHKLNCSKEHAQFDVALAEFHSFSVGEKESWTKYFVEHLAGTSRPRTIGDQAIVNFGEIVRMTNYTKSYDALIGVSCDSMSWIPWLRKCSGCYCVLHGPPKRLPDEFKSRVCWVNPMFEQCFFIPSDLPQFPKQQMISPDDKIQICLKPSTPDSSFQIVVKAVEALENTDNIAIRIMGGRSDEIPPVLKSISHLVTKINEPDYYKFEKEMAQCHVLLPLIHPWDAGERYFPFSSGKKLSGYLSQAIGLKIPSMMHNELYEVYKLHTTAHVWTYNNSDSFVLEFQKMLNEIASISLSTKL